ncbi:response regulator [Ohtaekwangia koreensis]|uniref:Response regulator receiver domain-containing protein n=1 Tax=Ohtaekwangia koreensis TaxID=688867 RepID=A0A1T5IWE8_9BACT|nr:response regulator [Ohtaekwangia koreensis]SKC43441.1 Response regulator receiver domain-containing protein [Ohtaekwangia koreensis]
MMRVINILLVEDDNLDVIDVKRTLDKMAIVYNMKVAKNGEEAIRLLHDKRDSFTVKPDFIILDLNMPKMNGLELLQILRSSEDWKDIKIFILTTSEENEDKQAAKQYGISGYIVKPLKFNNRGSLDAFNLMIDLMNMQN